jgi:hypothetical protein
MALHPIPLAAPLLTLGGYASVAARLIHAAGRPAADVLLEIGIPDDVWKASAAAWERALDDELARGEQGLLSAFVARFAATRVALVRAEPPPDSQPKPAQSPPSADLSNVVIGPETVPVDVRHLARSALPFTPGNGTRAAPEEGSARSAAARTSLPFLQPPIAEGTAPLVRPSPYLRVGPDTAPLDARWAPLTAAAPEPAAQPPPRVESYRAGWRSWWARLWPSRSG